MNRQKETWLRAYYYIDAFAGSVRPKAKDADTKACGIFINFSVMGVTRLLPKTQSPDIEVIAWLNKVMGHTDWISQIYREPASNQLSLFGRSESTLSRETIQAEWLSLLYTKQLGDLFEYISKSVLMRNSMNSVLYALCLASHNQTAIKITNEIFKRHEQLRKS
jgi:three-Cys-motif partner protein